MGLRLDPERSIADVAKLAGMSERNMRRKLVSLHAEQGNLLKTYGTGKRKVYRVTLGALKKAMPHVFLDTQASVADVEQLRDHLRETNLKLNAMAAQFRAFQKKAWEWFKRPDR